MGLVGLEPPLGDAAALEDLHDGGHGPRAVQKDLHEELWSWVVAVERRALDNEELHRVTTLNQYQNSRHKTVLLQEDKTDLGDDLGSAAVALGVNSLCELLLLLLEVIRLLEFHRDARQQSPELVGAVEERVVLCAEVEIREDLCFTATGKRVCMCVCESIETNRSHVHSSQRCQRTPWRCTSAFWPAGVAPKMRTTGTSRAMR